MINGEFWDDDIWTIPVIGIFDPPRTAISGPSNTPAGVGVRFLVEAFDKEGYPFLPEDITFLHG